VATSREIGEQDETDFLALSATEATFAGDASAATVTRDCLRHGTASCRSALPVFDGNIRKRPAALGNEELPPRSPPATVTTTGHSTVSAFFTNRASAADVVVNCMLVDAVFTALESIRILKGASVWRTRRGCHCMVRSDRLMKAPTLSRRL
jgi:hypothetical protein